MKARLHHIKITNFKAFREFELQLEGRHLLLFGANGAGKSSLYWSLFTFLQSARKPKPSIQKYFDPTAPERLLNIHEQKATSPKPGEIALTFRDTPTRNDTVYRISQADHGTANQPLILKGDLASDFITYRFFFGFSDFRNSEKFDLWPLFEKEILPFCVSTSGQTPLAMWERIRTGDPNPRGLSGYAGSDAYSRFKSNVTQFATALPGIVDSISNEAQRFYDEHFAADDPAKVTLRMAVTTLPSATGSNQTDFRFTPPVVEFGIQVDGQNVGKPQSFLNEAKLTQLALSVRFAASLVNLHDSDLKLLVLDDLLVSLDMSNRMKVVEILLSPTFASYQKIILTHELGFFREFRRWVGADHASWCFLRLQGQASGQISVKQEKTDIQKAEDYLAGHDLEEAAVFLRKSAEAAAKQVREFFVGDKLPPGDFYSLTENLKFAKNKLQERLPRQLFEKALKGTPKAHRGLLLATDDADLDANPALDAATKGRLKGQRKRLKQLIDDEAWEIVDTLALVDELLGMTDRVLNPAAHGNEAPLYEEEIEKALVIVRQFGAIAQV